MSSPLKQTTLAFEIDYRKVETQGSVSSLGGFIKNSAADLEGTENTVELDAAGKALLEALMEELGYGQEGETEDESDQGSIEAGELSSQEVKA